MNGKYVDITGMKFGRLTAVYHISRKGKAIKPKSLWMCTCECGGTAVVDAYRLKHGETKSCGCIVREGVKPRKTDAQKRLRRIWIGMKQRCLNPSIPEYKYYGLRGIAITNEWLDDFETFYRWAIANGYQNDLTIDRISSDGNYEPSNCRWITIQDQQRNRRNNVHLTIGNETHSMTEWSKISGTKVGTISFRHKRGWSDIECVYGRAQ